MRLIFIGLDGEMTGSDVRQHELIQIGVAFSSEDVFCSSIGWDEFCFCPESLNAISINEESIRKAPRAGDVDAALVTWLQRHNIEEHSLIPVGWEVATFDKPFVYKTLPKFSRYLHHHSVDLNAVVYTLGDVMPYLGQRPNSAAWKKMAKSVAEVTIRAEKARLPKSHDAGEDAIMALAAWRWIRHIIADGKPGYVDAEPYEISLYALITSIDATRGQCSHI